MPVASRSARERGVTIVELVVALMVLGIVIFTALPSYHRWIANTQVRTAAESVQNGLRLAASEAVRRNVPVEFVRTLDPAPGIASAANIAGMSWIVRSNPPAPDVAELIDSKPAAEATRSATVAANAAAVSFTGLGRLVSGSALTCMRFAAPNGDRPLIVTVTTGGSVRMCDPAFPANDPRGCPGLPAPCV
jgi:type IV fimbrial biogenesis protein FimT